MIPRLKVSTTGRLCLYTLTLGFTATLFSAKSGYAADAPAGQTTAPTGTAPFTFVVFGDNRPDAVDKPIPPVFKQIISEVRNLHPAFVVTTGDLVLGSAKDLNELNRQYDEVLPLVRSLGVPAYFAAGNHEIRGVPANEQLYRQRISDKLYFSFDYANCHFVILDSDIVGQEHKIAGEQFTWLDKDLQAVQGKAQHIFVFSHQQPYPVSLHIGSSLDVSPADRDRLQHLLEQYHVEAYITGHEHLYDDAVHGGVREIISGGAGAPLYPSKRGGSFHHYLVITIDGPLTFISVVRPGSAQTVDQALTPAPVAGP